MLTNGIFWIGRPELTKRPRSFICTMRNEAGVRFVSFLLDSNRQSYCCICVCVVGISKMGYIFSDLFAFTKMAAAQVNCPTNSESFSSFNYYLIGAIIDYKSLYIIIFEVLWEYCYCCNLGKCF